MTVGNQDSSVMPSSRKASFGRVGLLVASFILLVASTAMAFPDGWARKAELVIQSSKVAGELTDFPVLLTEDNLPAEMFDADGANPALNGGGDIRFSADVDGDSLLSCEIVTFVTDNDPANGDAEIWVKLPKVSATSNTSFWVWYGKAGEVQPARDAAYGSESVWDADYLLVLHLNEDPAGTAPQFLDATSNSHDATNSGGITSANSIDCAVGKGLQLEGATDDDLSAGSWNVGGSAVTVQHWVYSSGTNDGRFFSRANGSTDSEHLIATTFKSGNLPSFYLKAAGTTTVLDDVTTVSKDQWHFFAGTYDGSNMRLWIDSGNTQSVAKTGALDNNLTVPNYIGDNSTGGLQLTGRVDEVRVTKGRRSDDWLGADYNNQSDPGTFVLEQTPESANSAPVLNPIGSKSVDEGANLNFGVSASDPDETTPTLTAEDVPINATFVDNLNGTGTFDFNPDYTQSGTYNVRFIASDGALADTEVVAITVGNVNLAPELASIGAQSVDEGANLNFGVSATDPDETTPTLTAEDVPINATFVDNLNGTGTFDFNPDYTQSGTYNVRFIASDGALADTEVVAVTVNQINLAPILNPIGSQIVTEGQNLNLTITSTDPDATTPALTAEDVPTNATFVDNGDGTGTFDFNPSYVQSGVYSVRFITSDGVLADSEVVEITVNEAGNQSPILDPIGPKVVEEGQNLNFTVTASDPDETTPTLAALDLPTGASFADNGDGTGTFDFTPGFTQDGIYNVTFIASDGLLADIEVVQVTVSEAGNQAPVLASIGPKTATEDVTLVFGVSASDPDETTPSLTAEDVPANANFTDNGDGTGSFTFTPGFTQAGIYNVRFIASDGALADSEIVEITVLDAGNQAPVLASIGPKSVTEGDNLNFNIAATDPDATTPSFTAEDVPTNATFLDNGDGTGTFDFNPNYIQAGTYNVRFIASDGALTDTEVVAITVDEAGNQAPELAFIGPKSVTEGDNLNFNISASDPDATVPSFTAEDIPTNAAFVDNGDGTGTFDFNPDYIQAGTYNVRFIASDGALTDTEVVAITVDEAGNQAPVLASIGPKLVTEGDNLNFSITATDPDATTPSFIAEDVPTNATFLDNGDGTGTFDFNPNYIQAGVYNVRFITSDGALTDTEVVAITVDEAGNQSPVLASIGSKSVTEGDNLNFNISATDPDATTPSFTAEDVPTNATFLDNGDGTGTFDFNPNYIQAGSYNVRFIASDGALTDTEVVTITVDEAGNQSPVIDPVSPQVISEGETLVFGVSAADPDSTVPSLRAEFIPTNGSFADNGDGTGTFTFTPDFTQSGIYSVRFIASDGTLEDTTFAQITVNESGNQSPVLTSIGPKAVDEGQNLSFAVSATDPDETTPSLIAESVPTNGSFVDNGNGTGSFSFDPDFTQSGAYDVRFIASDGVLADTEVVTITVNNVNLAPELAAIGAKSVDEGANLNFGVSATDPDGTTPSLTAEDVPVNATFVDNLNGTGTFDFNPDYTQSGTYNVRFIASDGALADTEVVAITVNHVNLAPELASIGPKSVAEGANLNFGVSATDFDGTTPTLTAEDIPTNGSFFDNGDGTGVFDFNPDYTQSGAYDVRFIASDGVLADTEVVTITVNHVNLAPTLDPIGSQVIYEGDNLNVLVTSSDFDGTTPTLTAEDVPLNATFVDNLNGTGTFDFNPDFDQSGDYTVLFIASDGSLADSEYVSITVYDLGTGAKPAAIIDLNAQIIGDAVDLDWSEVTTDEFGAPTTVSRYVVYRNTKAYFDPTSLDSIGGVAFGMTSFSDSDIGGADVVGDTATNYFYVVKSVEVSGLYSDISNRVGEYDYQIIETPTTNYNLVALPFASTGITNAQGLVSSMGGTANVLTVNSFIASSQSYSAWFAAGFGNNFAVSAGSVFQVNAAADFVWSVAGQVPDSGSVSYGVTTTATTDYSLIMIPFEYEDTFNFAQDVIDNIPGLLNTLNEFVPSSQSYRSRFAAGFGTNFEVRPGRVYQANGASPGTFPAP